MGSRSRSCSLLALTLLRFEFTAMSSHLIVKCEALLAGVNLFAAAGYLFRRMP